MSTCAKPPQSFLVSFGRWFLSAETSAFSFVLKSVISEAFFLPKFCLEFEDEAITYIGGFD